MKMMQGACFLPCSKRSRTRLAPTPTNISTKSEPEMLKNGTPASPAMARARRVLPVPGGPMRSTPLGIRPPRRWNFFGSLRKAMISSTSSLASSIPATSANVTLFCESLSMRAFRLAERHRLAAARLELAHEEEEHDADEEHREEGDERRGPERASSLPSRSRLGASRSALRPAAGLLLEVVDERLVGDGPQRFLLGVLPVDCTWRNRVFVVLDVDLGHLPGVHQVTNCAEADLLFSLARLQDLPDREEHHDKQDPKEQRLV